MLCFAALAAQGDSVLQTLMKAPKLSPEWVRIGQPELYDKDSVFKLIDGEAEAYFPYGFTGVVAVSYAKNGDAATPFLAEVYEMGSPLDAFGIYSSNREPESKKIAVGTEGFGDEWQIMFYQDKYFVKVRVDKPDAGKGLLECAQAISKVIGGEKNAPKELALIQIDGMLPQTEQYIGQSVLGYEFWPKGFVAEAKDGAIAARIFVVMFPSADAAAKSMTEYADYLKKEKQEPKKFDNIVLAHDPLYKSLAIEQVGKYVIGAAKLAEPEQAMPFIKRLKAVQPK